MSREGSPPPPPEPLAEPVVDTHCHLDLAGVPVATALAAAAAVGVPRVVQVGVDLASSRWGVALAEAHPEVRAAVAVHPNDAPRTADLSRVLDEIDRLAAHPRVTAVGETGLDRYRTGPDGWAAQEEAFRRHVDIARRHGRTLVIHDRDAHTEVLRVLDAEGAPDRVVMHCFSGDAAFARACAERGYGMSFAGNVTFPSAGALREAAQVVPAHLLLVETDAPFLTPVPYRGRPNASYLVPLTVRALAATRGEAEEEVAAAIRANAERFFWTQ